MPSTAVSRIGYEARSQTLDVWFRGSGKHYRYCDVPEHVYEAFRRSGAKGRFFNREIRDHYTCQLMPYDPDDGRGAV
jgi:hypothetical protein